MWRLYFGLVTLVTTTFLWSTVKGENIFEFRGVFNTFGERLYPNLANAEDTSGEYFDFFSNGFKVRDNVALWNNDNSTYIYMAFAAAPIVGTNDIPANAF